MIVAPSDGQMRSFYSQVGHCGPPVFRSWAIDKWPGAGEAGHLSFGPGIGLVDPWMGLVDPVEGLVDPGMRLVSP